MHGELRMANVKQTGDSGVLLRVGELIGVFLPAWLAILFLRPLVGEDLLARHLVVFIVNAAMIGLVWLALRLRGEGWKHIGLSFHRPSLRGVTKAVLQSVMVFAAAIAAVVVASVVMGSVFGRPEGADLSGYGYLRGNLPMLVLVLLGVYFNASFGEEVIYRGYLINRIAELGSGTRTAWRVAVLISSLVFGIIHSDWALVGVVQMASMGLALGVAYLVVRKNLWVTILAHGYADTILIVQLYFGVE